MPMKENLLGVLAGDVAYTIGTGAGVHIRFRKDCVVTETLGNNTTEELWKTTALSSLRFRHQ